MIDKWTGILKKIVKIEFLYDHWLLSLVDHSLLCSVEQEVLETLPLCQ